MPQLTADAMNSLLGKASRLLQSDPAGAERDARTVLAAAPRHAGALLMLGAARRRLGDAKGARRILEPLAAEQPRVPHLQQELGLALLKLGERKAALAALKRATDVRIQMPESWRAIADILLARGDVDGARAALEKLVLVALFDPTLKAAVDALGVGKAAEVAALMDAHLAAHPNDVVGMRLRADALARLFRFDDAVRQLERCLELAPDYTAARYDLGTVLVRQLRFAQALPHIERLLATDPNQLLHRTLMAACLDLMGRHDEAIATLQAVLADHPDQAPIWRNLGHGLKTVGRTTEAVDAYKRCVALQPGYGDAWWSLANLKTHVFDRDDVAVMTAQLSRRDLKPEDLVTLHYAVGKALEDLGDHATSFGHYAKGAAIRRPMMPYNADAAHTQMLRTKAVFTPEFLAARAGFGSDAPDPIFIVGLPRSGSTLVEQILASHPAVEGTMELPDIVQMAERVASGDESRYLDAVSGLDARALKALGEEYLDRARPHRLLGRPLFTDKTPNNFHHIGFIHLILPRAKIIDVRRGPLDSCVSAFRQHFALGHPWSYDLTELGRYYRDYIELMDHFDIVMPGKVHRVRYEMLVEDTENQVRSLLDACGLPFEDACLRFHDNPRAVRTPSAEQVRQPIFRDGLDHWRRYEAWLGPLKAALGPELAH